ncbi:hypothetical protein H6P81_001516 [Aristolochia fimbriata]|uniref:Uncharacterized protein n=1 Tax=Aristolochia fimbriata TaxID=158543 RepID=A0AAV7FBP3_ARIFI|nr:hypothetical protein H6P81_001516 [Aristolochia fimbriata]
MATKDLLNEAKNVTEPNLLSYELKGIPKPVETQAEILHMREGAKQNQGPVLGFWPRASTRLRD